MLGPVRFVLDPDRAPVRVEGFDEGGADPAHRVQHEVAGLGVVAMAWAATAGSILAGCAADSGT